MNRLIYIFILGIFFQSCQENEIENTAIINDVEQNETIIREDSLSNVIHEKIQEEKNTINNFLTQPFDLHKFKKIKKRSNSGGGQKEVYYYKPNYNGMYYRYFLFSRLRGYLGKNKKDTLRMEDGLEINVYKKYGKSQDKFIDSTEQLIEVRAKFNDFDLPELAFIGLDSNTIVKKFGSETFFKNECMVYTYHNNVLVLNIKKGKVNWLKYVRLKSNINKDTVIKNLYKI